MISLSPIGDCRTQGDMKNCHFGSGVADYADEAVDAKGNIDNSYWDFFGPIIHGRRAEIEYLAKHPDATPGTNVAFALTPKGGKIVSDVDAFKGVAAISIKRQGKTLNSWVSGKSDINRVRPRELTTIPFIQDDYRKNCLNEIVHKSGQASRRHT